MGSTVPAGYLICNGGAISRTTYSQLFAVIGTTYGSGDGSTTFNLPNLIDRFLQGSETSGTTGGEATHTLTIDEIPSHRHASVNRYSGTDDNNHDGNMANGVASSDTPIFQGQLYTDYTGGSNAHNNLPPYITSIPCIKAFDSVIDATTVSVAQLSDTKVNKAGDTMTGSLTAPSFITNGIDCSVDSQGDGWIRYSNGLQICYGTVSNNNNVATGVTRHSFPVAFSGSPSIALTPIVKAESNIYTVTIDPGNETTFIINSWANYIIPPSLTNLPLETHYVAIGKWK